MNRRTYRILCWLLPLGLGGCLSRPPEVHLVPMGYEGPLVVLYGQSGYPALPHSGDSLVFDFRSGCVLRTSDSLVAGAGPVDAFRYYYVGAGGKRQRICKVGDWDDLQQRPPAEPCVIITAGLVYSNATSDLLTSAQNIDHNGTRQTQLTDSLRRTDPEVSREINAANSPPPPAWLGNE